MSLVPSRCSAAAPTCSGVVQMNTPSLAAELIGFTTTGRPSSPAAHATAAAGSAVRSWRAQRTPARRSASIISNLSRRARDSAVPLDGSPSAVLSRSASSTADSCPGIRQTGS
jgi:hypothetical protein